MVATLGDDGSRRCADAVRGRDILPYSWRSAASTKKAELLRAKPGDDTTIRRMFPDLQDPRLHSSQPDRALALPKFAPRERQEAGVIKADGGFDGHISRLGKLTTC